MNKKSDNSKGLYFLVDFMEIVGSSISLHWIEYTFESRNSINAVF